jgi:hypothetical protein
LVRLQQAEVGPGHVPRLGRTAGGRPCAGAAAASGGWPTRALNRARPCGWPRPTRRRLRVGARLSHLRHGGRSGSSHTSTGRSGGSERITALHDLISFHRRNGKLEFHKPTNYSWMSISSRAPKGFARRIKFRSSVYPKTFFIGHGPIRCSTSRAHPRYTWNVLSTPDTMKNETGSDGPDASAIYSSLT